MGFAPAYSYSKADPNNPFACWGLVPTNADDVPSGSVVCMHPTMVCVGGTVVHTTGTNNGHAVGKGPLGMCYECRGKGYQNAADQNRNAYYWSRRPIADF